MTVLDTSVVVDYLLGGRTRTAVAAELGDPRRPMAPEVVVFEAVATLRRLELRSEIGPERASGAVADIAALPLLLYPTGPLVSRAWELRANVTTADGMFVTLADIQGVPLMTADARLARAARKHSDTEVVLLELG